MSTQIVAPNCSLHKRAIRVVQRSDQNAVGHWTIYRVNPNAPNGYELVGGNDAELPNRAFGGSHTDQCLVTPDGECRALNWWGPPNIYAGDMTGDGLPELLRPLAGKLAPGFELQGLATWGVRINAAGTPGAYRDLMFYNSATSQMANAPLIYGDRTLLADIDGSGRLALLSPFPTELSRQLGGQSLLKYDRENGIPYQYGKYYLNFDHRQPIASPEPTTIDTIEPKWLTIVMQPDKDRGGLVPLMNHLMADMNGDGLPDAVMYPVTGGAPLVAFNYGGDFSMPRPTENLDREYLVGQVLANTTVPDICHQFVGTTTSNGLVIADIDQDGRMDLVLTDSSLVNHGLHPGTNGDTNCYPTDSTVWGPRRFISYLRVNHNNQWVGARLTQNEQNTQHIPISIWPDDSKGREPGPVGSTVADVNGDGLPDLIDSLNGTFRLFTQRGKGGLLKSVSNAYGTQITVDYKPISDPSVHTQGTTCTSQQQQCINRGIWVASAHAVNSGTTPGMNRYTHTYKGATSDRLGRGWLGFAEHTVVAERTSTTTTTTYDLSRTVRFGGGSQSYPYAYPLVGRPVSQETSTTLEPYSVVSPAITTYETNHQIRTRQNWQYAVDENDSFTYRVEVSRVETNVARVLGKDTPNTYRASLTELEHDDYGNITSNKSVTTDHSISSSDTVDKLTGEKLVVSSTFDNISDATNLWLIGLERTRSVTSTTADGQTATRSWSRDYWPNTRRLQLETVEPGGGAEFEMSRRFDMDPAGAPGECDATHDRTTRPGFPHCLRQDRDLPVSDRQRGSAGDDDRIRASSRSTRFCQRSE